MLYVLMYFNLSIADPLKFIYIFKMDKEGKGSSLEKPTAMILPSKIIGIPAKSRLPTPRAMVSVS